MKNWFAIQFAPVRAAPLGQFNTWDEAYWEFRVMLPLRQPSIYREQILDEDDLTRLKTQISAALAPSAWDNNDIQFPRLIVAMIESPPIDYAHLAEHMGLQEHALRNLMQRAIVDWEVTRMRLSEQAEAAHA